MGNRKSTISEPATDVPKGRFLGEPIRKVSESYYVDDKSTRQVASLVTHKITHQKFCCKRVETSKLFDQGHDENLDREVANLHRLTGHAAHANIVKLEGVIEDEDSVNLIMEWCPGGELFDRIIAKKRYSEPEAARLFQQILTAVEYCHSHGVMHMDLKPENFLFLSSDNFPLKAIEFGDSVTYEPGQVFQKLVGSAYYIAPEVLKRKYSAKADVWSAGVILYILLSGVPPFWAVDEQGILDSVLKGSLDFKSNPWPSISKDAKVLVKKMLQKDPNKRLSASDALRHEWMIVNGDPNYSTRLKQFSAVDELKKVVLSIIEKNASEDKFSDLKKMFKKMDKDRDGIIKVKDFKKDLKKLKKVNTYISGVKKSLKKAAMDDDGTVNEKEFITGTMHILMEEHVCQAFNCDKKKDGRITEEELKKVLKYKLNVETIKNIFAAVDKDNDGKIHYKELVEVVKNNPDLVPNRWRTIT